MKPVLQPTTIDALEKTWSAAKPKRQGGSGGAAKGGRAVGRLAAVPVILAGAMSQADRSDAAIAKLQRVVKRSPQVVVKVTGRLKGVSHVAANFKYIAGKKGRVGREDGLETDEGERLWETREFNRLAARWVEWDAASEFRRTPTTSISMVLSMPEGTDPDKLKDAVRAFAEKEFEGHQWVLGMHTDTPRPHAHLTVAVAGNGGERLNPRKADLQRFREEFARQLRDRGIDADATPRRARGIVMRPEKTPIRRMRDREARQRETGGTPTRSRYTEKLHGEVRRRVIDQMIETPVDAELAAKQRDTKWTYMTAVAELLRHDQPETRKLAGEIAQFVKDMPVAETRATELVKQLVEAREIDIAHEKGRGPRSPEPGPAPPRDKPER